MGVQGLSTVLDTHRQIYREVRFMRSRLLIDGYNLLYLLYFRSGLDENHGGDYAAFEDVIERFITALRDCRITPYVVFDGAFDYKDKKLETATERAEDRIRKAHQAAVGGMKQHILPLLAKLVFKQTLVRLEVPVAQCYSEADQEIAALAREWQCPVLSNDSDFYIFELPAGLLPISYFRWEEVERSGSQRYIPCLSYSTSSFCIFFNIQPKLLPTFAALAGNDYVKLQRKGLSISWAQFDPTGRETPSRIEGLLCWLKAFEQPQEAVEAVLGMMGELSRKKKVEVQQSLWLGMQEYQLPPSSLKRFFIHGVAPKFPVIEEVKKIYILPSKSYILNVLLRHQSRSLSLAVGHSDLPCACLTSRPLRQVMYGLLLSGGKSILVVEPERDGLQIKLTRVQPTFNGVLWQLALDSLDKVKAEPSERLQVILEALGVTEESLKHLPPQLRLPVAVTCYWLQKAQPPPDQTLLKALLLGVSNGDTLRQREGNEHKALVTISKKIVGKYNLDMVLAHSFSQWQICLKDSIHLNQLLGCPLPEPQIAGLYEGTLLHKLVPIMRTGGRLKSYLKNDRSSVKLYQTMQSILHQFYIQETSTPTETQKKVTAPQQQRQALDDLTTNLNQLFLEDEDEENVTEVKSAVRAQEDLHLNHLLSVRTRYRSKERNNRCNKPELTRKEERRGWDLLCGPEVQLSVRNQQEPSNCTSLIKTIKVMKKKKNFYGSSFRTRYF
uniref:XPG N-terminal domain-containing protein n=1 Tax=Anabas testudineus TaxID=64144 RepID=A0A3Q1J0L0_ANATE